MKSKWFRLKNKARMLRKGGRSIGKIEKKLGIPRSTLSGWFKDIKLSDKQRAKLLHNWKKGLINARKKAVLWHNAGKEKRIKEAENEAIKVVNNIDINDKKLLELVLAILYLGEGAKKNVETAIGNSDPMILKFFLALLRNLYDIDIKKIGCQLSLRADQDPKKIRRFWAKELGLSENNFTYIHLDKRTKGSKTYSSYKGVCQLRCANVAIQRKLMSISNIFCQKIIENNKGT